MTLTVNQWNALRELASLAGRNPLGEFDRPGRRKQATMTKLEREGYIEKANGGAGPRWTLTDKGKAL